MSTTIVKGIIEELEKRMDAHKELMDARASFDALPSEERSKYQQAYNAITDAYGWIKERKGRVSDKGEMSIPEYHHEMAILHRREAEAIKNLISPPTMKKIGDITPVSEAMDADTQKWLEGLMGVSLDNATVEVLDIKKEPPQEGVEQG